MKRISFLILYLFITSCAKDKVAPSHGSATFSMSAVGRNANGGRVSANATPTSVLLSIKDSNGNSVFDNKKLTLTAFGQGYVSESLQLNVGNYTLTQFIVLNAGDTTIYATPLEGSDLAQYVNDPLPINFTITENGSTTVVPEVIAVEQDDKPESLGYVDFGFEVVIVMKKVRFELYTDQDYSTDSRSITFKSQIHGGDIIWDSTFTSMLIKDVPKEVNKIVFEKLIPNSTKSLRIGFDYVIENVGESWYYEEMLPSENSKVVVFKFK